MAWLEPEEKIALKAAMKRENNKERDISKLIRALLKAYIALVDRANGRELPPLRLEGFENNVKTAGDCPSLKKYGSPAVFIPARRELKMGGKGK